VKFFIIESVLSGGTRRGTFLCRPNGFMVLLSVSSARVKEQEDLLDCGALEEEGRADANEATMKNYYGE
jgi:hypothetical protein